jgi:hypothetical protein
MAYVKEYSPVLQQGKRVHAGAGSATAQGSEFGKQTDTGLGLQRWAHAIFNFATDGGAISTITPLLNATIPANAIVLPAQAVINSPTAVTSAGSATIGIGTSAGSSTTSILAATAKTAFSTEAVQIGSASAFKMTASGSVTLTVAVAALTAGLIEIWVPFVVAANS